MSPQDIADEDAEMEALYALQRERDRQRGAAAPPKPAELWAPTHPIALALWEALPESGRGVDYWRTLRMVAERLGCGLWVAQQAALGLVLVGKVYVTRSANPDDSWIGRGDDPRVGAATYRTGSLGGLG